MLGNQLHFLAMSQGLCRKKKLFTRHGRAELSRTQGRLSLQTLRSGDGPKIAALEP